jgi:colicin import membrane protein
MHALLAFALVVSVKWQTRPEAVVAELWTPESLPPVSEPAPPEPVIEAPPPPPPVRQPEPVRQPAPEIKLKVDKKPKEAPPDKPKVNKPPAFEDLLARETNQLDRRKADQDRQRRLDEESRLFKQASEERENSQRRAARARSEADYTTRIKGKIRGNLVQPPNLHGNPVAQFVVTQLPSGEVLEIKLRRSSGNPLYDDAVERAIRKSSPLPRPDDPGVFSRDLALTFCPDEERGCGR